jgi:iron(II)-dependent oxidoreductase
MADLGAGLANIATNAAYAVAPPGDPPDFLRFGPHPTAAALCDWIADTRRVTAAMVAGFARADWLGPRAPNINPPLWELGHLAWFWEKWLLRGGDTARAHSALLPGTDALYDSMAVAHDARWDLPLASPEATWAYLDAVLGRVRERLHGEDMAGPGGDALAYFVQLCVFHQDMHNEAFAIRRQLLGLPAPVLGMAAAPTFAERQADIEFADGVHVQGAQEPVGFAFDNEKWAHAVPSPAFAIAAHPVNQGEFAAFVDAGGYARRQYWSAPGWQWREAAGASAPRYWRRAGTNWEQRVFDHWRIIDAQQAVMHLNAHEAQAYCTWASRRLPTETEWERAWPALQGRGAVWEWTSTTFAPYPGFRADPYADYSQPWFDGAHRVLRGGSIATAPRNLWRTWRNFYLPERGDMFCGLRTCVL